MSVLESELGQLSQSGEIQHVFEASDMVVGQVQVLEISVVNEGIVDHFYFVPCQIELPEILQSLEAIHPSNMIVTKPELLDLDQM